MSNVLEWFQNVDFSPTGEKILSLIDGSDPCFIGLILILLVLLGSKMSAPFPALRTWGLRAALAGFLSYIGYVWFTIGIGPDDWTQVVVRGAITAGFVLAPLWIVFPVLLFVYGRLRLALAAFLIYLAYAWIKAGGAIEPENWTIVFWQSGAAAGLAILVAWIVQPITDFIMKNLFPNWKWNEEKPSEDKAKQEFPRIAEHPLPVPLSSESRSPAIFPEEVLAFLRNRKEKPPLEVKEQADRQRRRQQARMKVELCYALHEPILSATLPRTKFAEFVDRYLSDDFEPEIVEGCAQYLEAMLFQQAGNVQPVFVQPATLPDLTQWFFDEQQKIEKQESDQKSKKTQLAGLTRKYTQLAEQFIEEELRN